MIKEINIEWLEKHEACIEGINWVKDCKLFNPIKLIETAIKSNNLEYLKYCNWGITKLFNKKQNVLYAIYSAKECLQFYESKYPNDDRPRKAIESAEKYIKRQTKENKAAAESAAWSAALAAESARSAWSARSARSAALAARSAALAAESARSARSAWSAALAAESARSAALAEKEMYIKILKYGIELLK
jgi:hypothetical protein